MGLSDMRCKRLYSPVGDPVPGKELLRLGEHTVRDGLAILSGAHALGLVGAGEALGGHELTRFPGAPQVLENIEFRTRQLPPDGRQAHAAERGHAHEGGAGNLVA